MKGVRVEMLQQQAQAASWPDPESLGDELPPVDKFNMQILPASFRPLIEDVSERMQAPPELAAAAAIVGLAGVVNRRARIHPKVEDTTWEVIPNLWGASIAPPGFMKSPTLRAITAPHEHIEQMWRAEYESQASDYEDDLEKKKLKKAVWREEFKRAEKSGTPAPVEPDDTLTKPAQRRLILTDATYEKLHEILAENPAGVLMLRDELVGWLAQLDHQGREPERGFMLQAWNGDGGFTVDRIGRGSIFVPAVCVSLFGCIQPSRLRWYLSQAADGGATDDGLLQRFQVTVWPDLPREWKLVDRTPNNAALACVEKVLSRLANLSADMPVRMHFDPEAQRLFFSWWAELEQKIRTETGLHHAVINHFAKYRSLMPSIAGLFELADRVGSDQEIDWHAEINSPHTQQAISWCDLLASHARRIYSCLTTPELHAARELAKHIQQGDLGATFSTREVYFAKHWSGLDTPESVRLALAELEAAGWVRRVREATKGGRPSESWDVNPKVKRTK